MADPRAEPVRHAGPEGDDGVGRENALLRRLVTLYRHLSGLALQDSDVDAVARLLAERIAMTVAIVGHTLDVLAVAGHEAVPEVTEARIRDSLATDRLGRALGATRETRRALRLPLTVDASSVIVAPIVVGDEVVAYILTFDAADSPADDGINLLVIEHAATICGVILGRDRVVAAAAGRVRADLVEGLLMGHGRDGGEAQRWAQHLGYDPERDHRVLSAGLTVPPSPDGPAGWDDGRFRRIAGDLEHFFTSRIPEAITATREEEVAVVLPEDAADPRRLGGDCIAHIGRLAPDAVVTIGLGGTCRAPSDIARSYAEARRTVDTARRLRRPGEVIAFDDLGIHRLLLQVPDLAELRAFADEVLGKLSLQGRDHRSEYLWTLGCFFRENNSPQRASKTLHVHPNTVAYRIKRIEEITGLDLGRYRDRLMAQVALEILGALGNEP